MALCDKDDVKSYLKMTGPDDDDEIDALIPAAQGFIENYCRRSFEGVATPSETIEYHHGGTDRIFLKQFPIDSTFGVKIYEDYSRVFAEDTKVDTEDYYVDCNAGIIFCDYMLSNGWGAVKVIYKTVAVPEDSSITGELAVAKQACIEIVARKLKLGKSGDIGVMNRTSGGGGSVTFSMDDILPETKIALDSISSPL